MKTIDLQRIREALPKHANVTLHKTEISTPYIRIEVSNPSLYNSGTKQEDEDIRMIQGWLDEIIGEENIMEVYQVSTGTPWIYYLNRNPYEFVNLTDGDVNSFNHFELLKDGHLAI